MAVAIVRRRSVNSGASSGRWVHSECSVHSGGAYGVDRFIGVR